jgi:signal transduction histidine kinase
MIRPLSLRWRLVAGTLLWTIGLAAIVNQVSLTIVSRQGAWHMHVVTMIVLAVGCMAIGLVQVGRSVSSLQQLRSRLAMVREGRESRVPGKYPSEVQPLVDELNALLDHREKAVARAQTRAGDLAHGLKTPLAVLSQEAERAGENDRSGLAETVSQQVERMRRQVEYHLAHARAASSGATSGVRCAVAVSADGLARTLTRLYADRGLAITVDVDPGHVVRTRREDLDEMLGNLLDNACKWARSRVEVHSFREGRTIVIAVDDDGPGIEATMYEIVLKRGVRADEAAPGSGLGLAIVRDLAELHGGTVVLDRSPLEGLRARLTLADC